MRTDGYVESVNFSDITYEHSGGWHIVKVVTKHDGGNEAIFHGESKQGAFDALREKLKRYGIFLINDWTQLKTLQKI